MENQDLEVLEAEKTEIEEKSEKKAEKKKFDKTKVPMIDPEKDVFDKLMNLDYAAVAWFRPYYVRYKQFLLYALCGLGTVIIAMGSYAFFTEHLLWNILIANAVSWIFATLFAFLSNRKLVFTSHKTGFFAFWLQLGSFSFGRAITLVLEEWMLLYFVYMLGFPNMLVKLFAQIVVIVVNYFISKWIVFRRKK